MNFLNPWLAAAVAAIVIPALLILYFLKLRRREELVPSTLLWRKAVQDLQVNAPFQRLRKSLLLLLQLLILALAILALARPMITTTVAQEDRLVLLIDRSASMNAVEPGGQTRLELAKEQATRLVRTLNQRNRNWWSFLRLSDAPAQTQAMVIAFAERATIASPFTTNTGELVDLIRAIEPSDGQTDLREALALAEAYMAPPTRTTDATPVSAEVPSTLVLISDGRIANLDQVVLRGGTLEFMRIGDARDNVGITSLRALRNYERPEELTVLLTVSNFGPEPVTTDASIYVDGTLQQVSTVTLGPRPAPTSESPADDDATPPPGRRANAESLTYTLTLDRAAVIEARLARADALAPDNRAFAVVAAPERLRVLVVTEQNFLLDSVLAGQPLAEYPFVTPAQYEADPGAHTTGGQSRYDVVIFDKITPEELPVGRYLFLGGVPPIEGFALGDAQTVTRFLWWDEDHPVLRNANIDPVVIFRENRLTAPADARILAETTAGPALVRYAAEGRQCLVLSFPVEMSTWALQPSFPIFMYNAIRYLGGGAATADEGPLRPGSTLRIPVAAGRDEIRLHRPNGGAVTLRPDPSGVAYYGETDAVGIYRAEGAPEGADRYAVNIEDERESDLTPPPALKIGQQEVAEVELIRTATPEVWRWFVGAGLALLFVEWWIYNRRVMI